MRLLPTLFSVALIALCSACSTLSEQQCRTTNWAELGERDGYNGQPRDRLYEHQKSCSEHGVAPDSAAYNAGWDKGVRLYCTPQRGYDIGKSGAGYRQTCLPELEAGFLRGYGMGQSLYQEQRRANDIERDIRSSEAKLSKSESTDERDSLRRRIRDLDDELSATQRRLRRLQDDAAANGFY